MLWEAAPNLILGGIAHVKVKVIAHQKIWVRIMREISSATATNVRRIDSKLLDDIEMGISFVTPMKGGLSSFIHYLGGRSDEKIRFLKNPLFPWGCVRRQNLEYFRTACPAHWG